MGCGRAHCGRLRSRARRGLFHKAFIRGRLEEMLKVCYEYGCYFSLQRSAEEISFSVFAKVYYTGMNFYSLKDTLRDFDRCVLALADLLKIDDQPADGVTLAKFPNVSVYPLLARLAGVAPEANQGDMADFNGALAH